MAEIRVTITRRDDSKVEANLEEFLEGFIVKWDVEDYEDFASKIRAKIEEAFEVEDEQPI